MKFTGLLALAGLASAATLNHRHFHTRRSAHSIPETIEKRDVLSTSGASLLSSIGIPNTGSNAVSNNGAAWLGNDGPYTNDFTNESGEDIVLVIWGPAGSWVNTIKPIITVSIPAGAVQTVSFANGASGGWAAVYPDTKLSPYGQIDQTWGEFTFNGQWSTYDVSREVNMSGKPMSIASDNCVSDFTRCVFQCLGGVNTCLTGYELSNCEAGSQVGAQIGYYAGAPSGGCSGMTDSGHITTTFS